MTNKNDKYVDKNSHVALMPVGERGVTHQYETVSSDDHYIQFYTGKKMDGMLRISISNNIKDKNNEKNCEVVMSIDYFIKISERFKWSLKT